MEFEANFAADDGAPASVRELVRELLENWGVERATREDMSLTASEIAKSALRQADGHITVHVRLRDGRAHIEAR